ncbi:MAG: exodeoxyribonuclease V subunit alpha, partial [Deltaproteobacteria bacterium]|nr:exodeoxyribonuclease V subunit alpha [Deltaproteobacteria bacterium]
YRPLIFDDRTRLYLYRYWDYERTLANALRASAASEIEKVEVPLLSDGLSRLFPGDITGETDWQKVLPLYAS